MLTLTIVGSEQSFPSTNLCRGSGIFLSHVDRPHGIARQRGGFVQVESEPRLGSTFDIYLLS